MKQQIKLLLLFICLSSFWKVNAQTGASCSTALNFTLNSGSYIDDRTISSIYWYKFTPTNDSIFIIANSTATNKLQKLELFSNSCGSLVSIAVDSFKTSNPKRLAVLGTNLNTSNSYYVKLTPIDTYTTPYNLFFGTIPELIWSTGAGSGSCMNGQSTCEIYVCLGESICLAYDYANGFGGGLDTDVITFNNGDPSITIPNTFNNFGACTNYVPSTVGTIIGVGGILDPFIIHVLPSAPPTLSVSISPSNPICAETPVCIQSLSTPIIDYSFSSSTSIPYFGPACSGSNTSTFAFPPGNHQIVYTVNAGHTCSNTATYSITVASMSLSLTAITPTNCTYNYCFNVAPTTCSVASNVNYSWQIFGPSGYNYNTTGTSQSICNVLPSSGTYTISVYTPDLINTVTQTLTIVVPPLTSTLTVVASPTTTICRGNSVTLTASGVNTYTWSTGANTPSISVTPTVTTTYTVNGSNTLGCLYTKTITITVVPIPTITAVANPSVNCASQPSTLTASGATSYTWSNGATTSTTVVTPSVTTIYTVTGSTSGCVSTKTVAVTINAGQFCCQTASFAIGSATVANTNYSNTSNGGGSVIDVLGTITFTANSTMTNYKIRMAPTASININTGVTVTFSNCTIFSCTNLWGGIFINDGVGVPGIVNVIGSRIEDMYMGIVHKGQNGSATGSTNFINVSNSVLNNNYIAIQLNNYPKAHPTALRQGLSVTGSTISSQYSATSPQNTLKSSSTYTYAYNNINSTSTPYVNFPRGIAGIYLYNLEEIPVILGDSTGTAGTNRFENLDFGVYAENASIKAFNNHFINISGSAKTNATPAGPGEIGVGINAFLTNGTAYTVRVGRVAGTTTPTGGNPYPSGNKFEDCGKGIAISNYNEPFVKGNVFTSVNTSLTPNLVNPPLYLYYKAQSGVFIKEIKSNATVMHNYFLNHSAGVYTSHNINTSLGLPTFVKVENNLIEAPGTNGYCRQAIQVEQPVSTTNLGTGLLTVKNNTIQNVYRGIMAFNVKGGLQINSNPTINLSASKTYGVPGTTQAQINTYARTGIYVQSCENAVVANNPNITSNGTISSTYYYVVRGIWFNASSGTTGQVNCNVINNMGRAMQFQGTSLNKISKNVMNGSGDYQGFVLSLNGQIGDQGHTTTTTHDNEWNGFTGGAAQYAETYTESSGNNANTNSRFLVKSGSPFQPTQNYSNATAYVTGFLQGIDVRTGLSGETCLALRMIGGDDNSNTDNGSNAMRMVSDEDTTNADVFEALASDTTFYDVYQNETQYRNKQLVYELINAQSIDATQTLNNFYEANQNSNYQTLTTINDAFANADYQTAQNINSSLTANNLIEEYQKRVNELLIKYINYQSQPVDLNAAPFTNKEPVFTSTELAELSVIANSCFDKFGSVITQARVLMNNVSNTIIEFEENCKPEFNQRKGNKQTISNSNKIVADVLPNPNNGNFTLKYNLAQYPNADLIIYDVTGKVLSKTNLLNTENQLDMNVSKFENGIYYYTIKTTKEILITDKFVIIK